MDALFIKNVETIMADACRGKQPQNLYQPIDYILSQGGKRIRPTLVALGCELFGAESAELMHVAAAFEMLHNFTLIHDDIMDDAPIRRGKATVYHQWNTNIAILSGDALFALAMEEVLKISHHNASKIAALLAKTSVEICEGQQSDLDFEQLKEISITQYIDMITYKTSVLLGACLKAGALMADADEHNLALIYEFGLKLGIAFQLKDDLLDVYADAQIFGKQNGGDIKDNKKTYLYLKALELASDSQKQELLHYFSSTNFDFSIKFNAVKNIYEALNIPKITEDLIEQYSSQALEALADIQVEDCRKENLKSLCYKMISRKK